MTTPIRRAAVVAVLAALATVAAAAKPATAQWLKDKTPGIPRTADGKADLAAPAPKTADGHPDLSGIWRPEVGGYEFNLVTDLRAGEILPWAEELAKRRKSEFGRDDPAYRCMPSMGPLFSFNFFKILQTPTALAFLSESGGYRQILADGRKLPVDPNPTWIGYAVGSWSGDTLVVESAGFNDQSWLDTDGHPHSDALHVTEHYRRRDFGHMQIEMTFDDPKAYGRPWTIAFEATLAPDTELLEFVCNENERDVLHFVVTDADRRKSMTVVKVSPEVLGKYVGSYIMSGPIGPPTTFTVSVDGDQLTLRQPSGGKYVLVAESETVFTIADTPVEFVRDAQGVPTHFIVHTVEGDQKAVRESGPPSPR